MALRFTRTSVLTGLPILVIGATVAAITLTYPIGTPTRMGPGFMPLGCAIVLIILGALIAAFDSEPLDDLASLNFLRPSIAVFAGLVAWMLTVEPFGLVPATFLLVVLASLALPRVHWVAALVTAAALSAFGVLVFIMGLNIRLEAFG